MRVFSGRSGSHSKWRLSTLHSLLFERRAGQRNIGQLLSFLFRTVRHGEHGGLGSLGRVPNEPSGHNIQRTRYKLLEFLFLVCHQHLLRELERIVRCFNDKFCLSLRILVIEQSQCRNRHRCRSRRGHCRHNCDHCGAPLLPATAKARTCARCSSKGPCRSGGKGADP